MKRYRGRKAWLKLKRVKRVSDLPMQIETAATDRIGALYNFIRKELDDFFSDVRPTEDFRGAICGGAYDRDMQAEAGAIVRMYGMNISLLLERRARYERALLSAQQTLDEFPTAEARASQEGAKRRKELIRQRNHAQAALHFFEERCGRDIRNLINIVRKWAERKEDRAVDWLTALWDYASRSRRAPSADVPPSTARRTSSATRRSSCGS